ncbi:MAG: 50S ribosomal protein L32 [Firmicutes bacterium]|nr:50S ribosomal protein L32 [Bacillota bacterium]
MANPKGRSSRTQKRLRRTHWKLKTSTVSRCGQCQAPKLAHRACPSCGYYRGRQVVAVES